jgi:uncharacterized repeat protein (TIGR01451 family)
MRSRRSRVAVAAISIIALAGAGVATAALLDGSSASAPAVHPTTTVPGTTQTTGTTSTTATTTTGSTTTPTTTTSPAPTTTPATTSPATTAPTPTTVATTAAATTIVATGASTADVEVTKTAAADTVPVGGTIRFSARVVNHGPDTATGVTLNDTLPAELTLVSITATQGSCTTSPPACALGTLAAGAEVTVTIVTRANQARVLTNRTSVTAAEPDPALGNNLSAASVQGRGALKPPATSKPAKKPVKRAVVKSSPSFTG